MNGLPPVKVYDLGDCAVGVCGRDTYVVNYARVLQDILQRRPSADTQSLDGLPDPAVLEIQQLCSDLSPSELGELMDYLRGDPYYEEGVLGGLEGRSRRRKRQRRRVARRKARRQRPIRQKLRKVGGKIREFARKAAKKGVLRKAIYKVASKIPVIKYAAKAGRGISKGVQKAVYKAQKRRGGRIIKAGRKRVERGEDKLIRNARLRKFVGGASTAAASTVTSGNFNVRRAIRSAPTAARSAIQRQVKLAPFRTRAAIQRQTRQRAVRRPLFYSRR